MEMWRLVGSKRGLQDVMGQDQEPIRNEQRRFKAASSLNVTRSYEFRLGT